MMIKKLLLLIPLFLLAFTSKYTPDLNDFLQPIKCDKVLHKTAFDICYSCTYKHPLAVAYELKGDLVKKKISRKGLRFRPDYNLPTNVDPTAKIIAAQDMIEDILQVMHPLTTIKKYGTD